MTYYTTYITENIVNGKRYYGQHVTDNLNDGYVGSGVVLNKAIAKHGKDKFVITERWMWNSREEMNAAEQSNITEEMINSENWYNLMHGGKEGMNHSAQSRQLMRESSRNYWDNVSATEKEQRAKSIAIAHSSHSSEKKEQIRIKQSRAHANRTTEDENKRRQKLSDSLTGRTLSAKHIKNLSASHLNNTHSEETKQKMRASHKNKVHISCPHCDKTGPKANMVQWHLDKCKYKKGT